jgi:CheY-like chemotaxis protein
VAKILVADDNSNVQKTVALALADLGVEVVAVNNGDAAVRKLPDVNPDLVLADIFMPVRNGYEVCDYVKKDSRFSHVPVVLLVGAFDPLDEREAQRVGADGILKKPFVPPDPLIAMVKTLLDRALGERLVTVSAPQPATAEQNNASVATRGTAVKVEQRPPSPPPAPEPAQEQAAEGEFQPPVDRLSFGEGEHPIAFGQLLETPVKEPTAAEPEAIEPVEDDQVLTSSRDANLGEPVFWKPEEPEPESEESESDSEDQGSMDSPLLSWGLGEAAFRDHATSNSAHTDVVEPIRQVVPAEPIEPVEPFELVRDQADEPAGAPTVTEPYSLIAQDAAAQALLTVQSGKAEDLAANPLEWMATAPAPPQHAETTQEETENSWNADGFESADHAETDESEETPGEVVPESTLPPPPPLGVIPAPSFLGMPVPPAAKQSAPPIPPQANTAPPSPDGSKAQPPFKRVDQSAEDTARAIPKQEWADLAANLELKSVAPSMEKPNPPQIPTPSPLMNAPGNSSSASSAGTSTNSDSPDPALVEAVVQRVLDKMRPQVVDIITKEFLRPVVQALVHREITKH